MTDRTTRRVLLAAALLVPLSAACTDTGGGDADVQVSLRDDAVTLDPDSGAAGSITFSTTNEGTETHEIEVFRGDVDPATLPLEDNVASTDGLELVDEIEDITPGSSADLTVDLDVGAYVVMCNLPGHFERGMHATFEVA